VSLVKRLWIVVGLITLGAIVAAAGVNMLAAKRYLEDEIKVKNLDTATALAMSISQNATDVTTAELLVSSQFDLGHYQRIDYLGPDGKLVVHRERVSLQSSVPAWFTHLVPIEPEPGVAEIQSGWKQLGSIRLLSDPSFAYDSLWKSAMSLLELFAAGSVLLGALGTVFIRSIVRPLDRVVDQAEALADRRFIEIEPPRTLEFRLIVEAMNRFAKKIKNLLDEESVRLQKLKSDYEHDKVTGFVVRDVFLRQVASEIEREDTHEEGALLLVHIANLEELNRELGRIQTDKLINNLAERLKLALQDHPRGRCGRLNSPDFGVLVPGQTDGLRLLQFLHEQLRMSEGHHLLRLSYGAAVYRPGSTVSDLLAACDQSLVPVADGGYFSARSDTAVPGVASREWTRILDTAFRNHEFELAHFPVRGPGGAYLYAEALARIHSSVEGRVLVAGAFLPWARRRGQGGLIDLEILSLALSTLRSYEHGLCINLGFESVCDERQVDRIVERLNQNKEQAVRLHLDIAEDIAFDHPEEFRQFCERVIPTGCRVGVEHLDHYVGHLGNLNSLGLHYVKVSHALIAGVAQDATVQTMLRSLCTISHTMGLQVIAEGVTQISDVSLLMEIGFDGVAGPAVV
jgi:EAL domain-containing protein (putative c-di-GMP-specific phosphodiesterase class I)/GGDEF domain-containing protein